MPQTANLPQLKIIHLDILNFLHLSHLTNRSISVDGFLTYVRASFCLNRTDYQCWKNDWQRLTKKKLSFYVLEAVEETTTVKEILFFQIFTLP